MEQLNSSAKTSSGLPERICDEWQRMNAKVACLADNPGERLT
jgi:hypothetical protein